MQKVRDILRRGGFAVPDAFELEIPPTADKGGMEGETRRKNTAAVFRFRSHMLLASDIRQVMIELNSAFATQPVLQSFEALRALRRD
ncbi:MAG: hypothetical protein JWQ11_4663 [Rhizobacter sp.]|nr:hypothetical protein [Rhizobacter sp.]